MDTVKFNQGENSNIWVFNSNGYILNTKRIGSAMPDKLANYRMVPTLIQEKKAKFEEVKNSKDIKYSYYQNLVFHIDPLGKLKAVDGCNLEGGFIKNCKGHLVIKEVSEIVEEKAPCKVKEKNKEASKEASKEENNKSCTRSRKINKSIVTDEKGVHCDASAIVFDNIKNDKDMYAQLQSITECNKLTFPPESKLPKINFEQARVKTKSINEILAQSKADAINAQQKKQSEPIVSNQKKPKIVTNKLQPQTVVVPSKKSVSPLNPLSPGSNATQGKGYFVDPGLKRIKELENRKKAQDQYRRHLNSPTSSSGENERTDGNR